MPTPGRKNASMEEPLSNSAVLLGNGGYPKSGALIIFLCTCSDALSEVAPLISESVMGKGGTAVMGSVSVCPAPTPYRSHTGLGTGICYLGRVGKLA